MERGILSDKDLAKNYPDVVWMYLFQDFTHSDADRAAERVAIRFGISSWPQHFLIDPFTLTKLADTGRSLDSFRAAVGRAKVKRSAPKPSVEDLAAADKLAASLEKDDDVKAAKEHLKHEDRVVAFRALQTLVKKAPQDLVAESAWLLAVPNDQIRGLTCDVLAEHGGPEVRDALHGIVRDPGQSENPNVMRIRAVKALARCGDASSLEVIAPFATSGQYRNGLTMTSVTAVAAIGARAKKADGKAVEVLAKAYPPVPVGKDAANEQRSCEALAKSVHETLQKLAGKKVPFPGEYTEETRKKLMASW
jgi:hypothetical protein